MEAVDVIRQTTFSFHPTMNEAISSLSREISRRLRSREISRDLAECWSIIVSRKTVSAIFRSYTQRYSCCVTPPVTFVWHLRVVNAIIFVLVLVRSLLGRKLVVRGVARGGAWVNVPPVMDWEN